MGAGPSTAAAIARRTRAIRPADPVSLLEVRLEHREVGPTLGELFAQNGAKAHLIACRLTDRTPPRLVQWLDVEVATEGVGGLLHALRRRPSFRRLAVAPLGPGRILLRVSQPAPSICVATVRAEGVCASCPLLERAEHGSWRVVLPRGPRAWAFLRDLPGRGDRPPAIVRLRPPRSATTMTRRQDRALRAAYDVGYFDYPRRGSLAEVARELGIGRSAALELLRRATAKLAGARYGDELRARSGP